MVARHFHIQARAGDIAVTDHGGPGHTVLMVHTLAGVSEQWVPLCWELVPRFRPVTMDLRGHGQSRSRHSQLECLWQDVVDVVEMSDLHDVVVVAEELLCSSVRRAAAEIPNRIIGVLCINDTRCNSPEKLERMVLDTLAFSEDTELAARMGMDVAGPDAHSLEVFLDKMCEDNTTDWALDWYGGRRREVLRAMMTVHEDGSWLRRPTVQDVADALRSVHLPTLANALTVPVPHDVPVWYLDSTYPERDGADVRTPVFEPHEGACRHITIDAGSHPECTHPEDVAHIISELTHVSQHAARRRRARGSICPSLRPERRSCDQRLVDHVTA